MRKLQINAELFLPLRLEFLSGMVSLGLILSMVIGLNLRNVYPVFSAFSWGIPALTLSTVLLQMAFIRILLAMKLRDLEKCSGTKIAPMGVDEISKLKAYKRKAKK
jgi:hypothetical protein